MTNRELIEKLSGLNPDLRVYISDEGGLVDIYAVNSDSRHCTGGRKYGEPEDYVAIKPGAWAK